MLHEFLVIQSKNEHNYQLAMLLDHSLVSIRLLTLQELQLHIQEIFYIERQTYKLGPLLVNNNFHQKG